MGLAGGGGWLAGGDGGVGWGWCWGEGWTGLSGLGLSGLGGVRDGGVRDGGVRVLLLLCPGGAAALRPPLTVHH